MTLLHPKWLPSFRAPPAPIELFSGLEITATGEPLDWVRQPVTVNAFQIVAPEGVDSICCTFQFLSPTDRSQRRVVATSDLLQMQWNTVLLYPAGNFARRVVLSRACACRRVGGWLPRWRCNHATERGRTSGRPRSTCWWIHPFSPAATSHDQSRSGRNGEPQRRRRPAGNARLAFRDEPNVYAASSEALST